MRSVSLALALSLTFVAGSLPAQVLRGRVADAQTDAPLRSVELRLLNPEGRQIARASSDTSGMFELRAARPGTYQLDATLIGYATLKSDSIALRSRETVQVALHLSTQPVPITPLVITARQRGTGRLDDFERRRQRHGGGYFITQKDIEKRVAASASTLVLGVPGVSVVRADYAGGRSNIVMVGQGAPCRADVYIDGLLMRGET
ncbi:MAG: carboxypeptidase regulatory-like domain-containing protein, partial [Longimicrobiales bacterium]